VAAHLQAAPAGLQTNAELLTSELVTNALLHAGEPVTIEVRRRGDRYRVEVGDTSAIPPEAKRYRTDDATGRGLQLVSTLSDAWGWRPSAPGKVVWFELSAHADAPTLATAPQTPTVPSEADRRDTYPTGTLIVLLGAPIQAMIRTEAHYDALYREFRLISELEPWQRQAVPGRLLRLIDELGAEFQGVGGTVARTWEEALAAEADTVDLSFRLPAEAAPLVRHYDRLLDEADRFCRQRQLLTVAPPAEALAVRRWAFGEVVRQCQGGAPVPWTGPTP
jgi:hypothetical protein